jgi:2-methylisocitrate lyase-like PEP mutase family enzyme
MVRRERAEAFRALHHGKHILILPNAWDVPSARLFEEAGFPAIATSSAGLMVSLGHQDGETIPRQEFFSAVGRIAKVLSAPLTVDAVSGFGETPSEVASTVQRLVEIGAIGVNIEDLQTATGSLASTEDQVEKLKAIRKLDTTTGIPLVINARTDALRHGDGNEEERLNEAIQRSQAYRDAGADCVYPMGLTDAASIATFVKALNFPVNVMIRKGLPPIKELERLGVARVSFGPAASYATMGFLKRAAAEILEKGTYNNLVEGAITYDELNNLAIPRRTT